MALRRGATAALELALREAAARPFGALAPTIEVVARARGPLAHTRFGWLASLQTSAATHAAADEEVTATVFCTARVLDVRRELDALRATGQTTLPVEQLQELCQRLAPAAGPHLLQALHEAGVVLRVGPTVFLSPPAVVQATLHAVQDEAEAAGGAPPAHERLAALDAQKAALDVSARRRTRALLWTGLGVLSAQLALFARLTYVDLSWDVMEPAGFFVMSTWALGAQLYFLFTANEYSHVDWQTRLTSFFQRRLYASHSFDVDAWRRLRVRCGKSADN